MHEILRLTGISVIIQVHRQKGNFRRHITIPEALIELYAIKDNDIIRNADMFQMQIAVAVPNFMLRNPSLQKIFVGVQKFFHIFPDELELISRNSNIPILFGLCEVFVRIVADSLDGSHLVYFIACFGCFMKTRHFFSDGFYNFFIGLVL